MTINTTSVSTGPYSGNGVTDTFAYDFKVQISSQIIVTETDSGGSQTTLVEGTDYSVTGVGDNGGGTVVRSSALPSGYTWLIERSTELTQEADFAAQGDFTPISHENAFDKLTSIAQEIGAGQPPADRTARADTLYSFDSAGEPEANIDADAVRALLSSNTNSGVLMTSDTFTGDGSTTAYVLSVTPAGVNGLLVTIDGVVQEPTGDYTVSSSTLTFLTAPPNNSDIVVRNLGNTVTVVVSGFTTLDDIATPSVLGGQLFLTGGTTTITDFLNGSTGQEITIMSDHAITITDGTNIFLAGSVNFVMASTDTLTLIQRPDGNWYEKSRSVN